MTKTKFQKTFQSYIPSSTTSPPENARKRAVFLGNVLASNRLNYCNSLLCAIPKKYIDRLQKVQNIQKVLDLSNRSVTNSKNYADYRQIYTIYKCYALWRQQ